MGVPALTQLTTPTQTITESDYKALIRSSEQLRILKNFVKCEEVITKSEIEKLVKVMEANNE